MHAFVFIRIIIFGFVDSFVVGERRNKDSVITVLSKSYNTGSQYDTVNTCVLNQRGTIQCKFLTKNSGAIMVVEWPFILDRGPLSRAPSKAEVTALAQMLSMRRHTSQENDPRINIYSPLTVNFASILVNCSLVKSVIIQTGNVNVNEFIFAYLCFPFVEMS